MIHLPSIQRALGLLLMLFSIVMLVPLPVDAWYGEQSSRPFILSFAIVLSIGLLLWFPNRNSRGETHLKEAFLMVVLAWVILGMAAALPLYLSNNPQITLHDAVFEAISGLTTTGASVLPALDTVPHAILFYRQFLQWIGGIGIIVIAVIIAPMLGVGSMQLYRTEMLSSARKTKPLPRVSEISRMLGYIYLSLTALCAVAYWAAGMSKFDALCHSFSTVSIGGFSTHNENFGYFSDNPTILIIAMVFMLIAGINFSLHFLAWHRRALTGYWRDTEFKVFLSVISIVAILTVSFLYIAHTGTLKESVLVGAFSAISFATTTGYTVAPHYMWMGFVPLLLLFASSIGGCSGSTGGGMKVIRFWLLLRQGIREMKQLVHPSACVLLKIDDMALSNRVIQSVWGFFSAYIGSIIVILLLLMATGLDQETAFSATMATINNLGPGLGTVGEHYAALGDANKWILCFAMILGRLEIFALLILFTPMFWRK